MLTERTASDATLLDICGRRRSPATFSEFHQGRRPGNAGQTYPADPPSISEIVAVMKACDDTLAGQRLRALIVLLWRSGVRISEALALGEQDLNERENTILVRKGKGGKRRIIGMDDWGWQEIRPWLEVRKTLPVGTVFPVVLGASAGKRWSTSGARSALRHAAERSEVRRRINPHGFRHAHAVELAREGMSIHLIQRQLGHANLGVTAIYLASIGNGEVIDAMSARRAPMVPAM